jgi:dipeptidase
MIKKIFGLVAVALLVLSVNSFACTNFIVTKGASTDGSVLVSYAADSQTLFGELYHWPPKTYPKGTMLKIYEWDTGKYLGEIPQAEKTYICCWQC